MADDDVVIVGLGMMTAVGLSAAETAASVRAATMRFAETDLRDRAFQPFTLAVVIEDGLPDLDDALANEIGITAREARMFRLGTMPLAECMKPVAEAHEPVGLVLALPETETTITMNGTKFLGRFGQQTKVRSQLATSEAGFRGRAGGLSAIGRAGQRIREGQDRFVVAGGIDSYRDLFVLGTLDLEKRVKAIQNLDAFIPGEAAGFVLLTSRKVAKAKRLNPLAVVSPAAEGVEEGHLYSDKPYRGDGLATIVENLIQQTGAKEPIQEVFSSMNGENHWAKEWGVAFLRNKAAFAPEHGMHHPADCFGDTGAACGPLMVGLAALGIVQGYYKSPCLVYGSSDRGPRAALIVSSA